MVEPLLRELRQRVSTGDLPEGFLAGVLVQLDQREDAITALELYCPRPSSAYESGVWLRYNPLDSLRGHLRFQSLKNRRAHELNLPVLV